MPVFTTPTCDNIYFLQFLQNIYNTKAINKSMFLNITPNKARFFSMIPKY